MDDFEVDPPSTPNLNTCTVAGIVGPGVARVGKQQQGLRFAVRYAKAWPNGDTSTLDIPCYASGARAGEERSMDDRLKALQEERDRLHGPQFYGLVVVVDSTRMVLKIKDSRSTEQGGNPRDLNQAWRVHHIRPGTWKEYSLEESRKTFV